MLDKYIPRRGAAKIAAAFGLGCAVALILSAGGGSRVGTATAAAGSSASGAARAATTTPSRPGPATAHFADSPAGAAAAATAWCQTTTEAFIDGGWDRAVCALTIGAFRALALRYAAAAALVQSRLAATGRPHALHLWPLGYAIDAYSPTAARVRVWQLFVLAIAAPAANTEFTTTTVSLQWANGDWKVTSAPAGADLAPPRSGASPTQVAIWIHAAAQLNPYTHVP